jgi:hypothetical protein
LNTDHGREQCRGTREVRVDNDGWDVRSPSIGEPLLIGHWEQTLGIAARKRQAAHHWVGKPSSGACHQSANVTVRNPRGEWPVHRLAGFIHNLQLMMNEVRLRQLSCSGNDAFYLFRLEGVVGVQKSDEIATTSFKRRVQCGGLPAVRLMNCDHSVAVSSDRLPRVVSRSIVDHDRLDAWIRLGEGAFDRFGQKVCVVVIRNQNTDEHTSSLDGGIALPRLAARGRLAAIAIKARSAAHDHPDSIRADRCAPVRYVSVD